LDDRYVPPFFSFSLYPIWVKSIFMFFNVCILFAYTHIVCFGSHRMSVNTMSDEKIFPICFNETSKNDYKDAMYVVTKGNCVKIEELKSISDNEREESSSMW
jgi:hypothetical protein